MTAARKFDPPRASAAEVVSALLRPEFKFPTLPAVAAEVMALANASEVTFRDVDRVVRRDPILAARVVAVANSPMYSPASPVTSLRTAMMMLGWRTLRDVLWQVVAEAHVFKGGARRQLRHMREHGVAVAHITRRLCQGASLDAEDAFVCGLLHDIGRPLTLQVLRGGDQPQLPNDDALQLAIDEVHNEVGERVAQCWNLPTAVANVARWHHDPPDGREPSMAAAVAAAERLADHHGIGGREIPLTPEAQPLFDRLGFDPADLDMLIEQAAELVRKMV